MTLRRLLCLAVLSLACALPLTCALPSGSAFAADANAPAFYVWPEQIPAELLPRPPQEDSQEWLQDIETIKNAQNNLSDEDKAALIEEQKMSVEMVTQVLGEDFNRNTRPLTFALLDRTLADTQAITDAAKQFWDIRRPYEATSQIDRLIDPVPSKSYPSGHTTAARVLAEILGQITPADRDRLRIRAAEIAWHRIQAGVHTPSDIESGKLLAMLIVGALMSNADFESDLAAARSEQ
jgi:acid phosphatase (class A)